jgi:hypothetical protein
MKEDKDQRTGKIRKGLDLPPKLGRKVPAIFDSVFYLFQQEVDGADQRLLLTQKTENTIAKNRGTNALEQVMVLKDPSEEAAMPIIYNALIGA